LTTLLPPEVCAPKNDTHALNAGLAYVFVRDADGNWTQQAILAAPFPKEGDNFGHSVAISGDTIVVGTPLDDNLFQGVNPGHSYGSTSQNSGAAYVFTRTGNTWSQQAYLKASNAAAGAQFGWSVAIHGDSVIVGARFESNIASNSGAAYVFTRTGTSWSQQAYLKLPNAASGDWFGTSVGIDGDFAIVGALVRGGSGTSNIPGAAYIYERSGTTWSREGAIEAPAGTSLRMGMSVAISGNLAVVGAMTESSAATGVNGEETNTGKPSSGAAYILQRSGGTWTRTAFLKASNSRNAAHFGRSVAIDGRTVLVGSDPESSGSTGVNGPQDATEGFLASGAAYQFQLNDGQWTGHSSGATPPPTALPWKSACRNPMTCSISPRFLSPPTTPRSIRKAASNSNSPARAARSFSGCGRNRVPVISVAVSELNHRA